MGVGSIHHECISRKEPVECDEKNVCIVCAIYLTFASASVRAGVRVTIFFLSGKITLAHELTSTHIKKKHIHTEQIRQSIINAVSCAEVKSV